MMFSRPKTVARSPAPPATVAKTAARVASAAATATANARTPAAAAVARAAANKAAANARATAKKASNNQAAAKKAAAAAAKKAANQAAKSAAKANTTMVMLGRGFKNMTNKVKSLATQATALGGSAYATYLQSNDSEALMIAATCMVLLYIAYALLGRTPKTKVSVLQGQINTANSNLARRRKADPRHAVYKAYMRKDNVAAASKVMNVINASFAPNAAIIAAMRAQLAALLNAVVEATPIVASNRSLESVINKAVPFATVALKAYKDITSLEIDRKNATTAHMIAMTAAETARATADAKRAEQRVQAAVAPYTAQVRGLMGAVTNVATTATAAGAVLRPIRNSAVLGVATAARFMHRRRGGA